MTNQAANTKGTAFAWCVFIGVLALLAVHVIAVVRLDPWFVAAYDNAGVLAIGTVLGIAAEVCVAQAALNRIRHGRWIWQAVE